MEIEIIQRALDAHRAYFGRGATRELEARREALRRFKSAIQEFEAPLLTALRKDLGKPEFEAYASEIGILYQEIDEAIGEIPRWAKPKRVPTPLVHKPGTSRIHPTPLGVVLVLAPWNYPLQLLFSPLVGALAAGNCVVLKPSELAPNCARVAREVVQKAFDPAHVSLFEGGVDVAKALLAERFDLVFFTGGAAVGRQVMEAASRHLTPVVLELGGKSPCLIDEGVPLEVAARRVAWGKFFNAGQTCVAPDYVLVHESQQPEFLRILGAHLDESFGPDPAASPDFGRIVNERHFDRLVSYLSSGRVAYGGKSDRATRFLAPTLVVDAAPDSPLLQEEIFGPILPVVTYRSLDEALAFIEARPDPLALYLFTRRESVEREVFDRVRFGGGCVNDTLVHVANSHLPFGGIGQSGFGRYHGSYSFETFSHYRGVLRKPFVLEPGLRYRPYGKKLGLVRKILK